MRLAKEELSDIHKDWMEELDKHRKPPQTKLSDEEKAPVIKYIKEGVKDNGNGVVDYRTLVILIKKRFGYKISRTTVGEWRKL